MEVQTHTPVYHPGQDSGSTLTKLMVVLAMMAILASLAYPSVAAPQTKVGGAARCVLLLPCYAVYSLNNMSRSNVA